MSVLFKRETIQQDPIDWDHITSNMTSDISDITNV